MTDTKHTPNGFKDMAQRIVNAENNFIETLMKCGDCTKLQAQTVMNLYLKNKLAKMDAVIGRISVKHGAFLDKETICAAIAKAEGK